MRQYGGDVHFVCLEAARALAKKHFSFSLFYYAIRS